MPTITSCRLPPPPPPTHTHHHHHQHHAPPPHTQTYALDNKTLLAIEVPVMALLEAKRYEGYQKTGEVCGGLARVQGAAGRELRVRHQQLRRQQRQRVVVLSPSCFVRAAATLTGSTLTRDTGPQPCSQATHPPAHTHTHTHTHTPDRRAEQLPL
jgi:hypothetical protein